ncbi:UNVERIFIED_CONTAM: hypothetical protein Slati_3136000 [Sesamum latifolium]|uniref:Reverse transcriptase zinc-binding domain-containing protein n=1 Tax=Sesamum latifolium TaxID=2727402 RepID=A0AAW2UVG8_9LAMI
MPKVLLFAWICARDALPTVSNLWKRGVRVEGGCLGCGSKEEDLMHVLYLCNFARLTWALSDLPCRIIEYREGGESWLRAVFEQIRGPGFDYFLTICWALWRERNNRLFEGSGCKAQEIIGWAKRSCFTHLASSQERQSRAGVG